MFSLYLIALFAVAALAVDPPSPHPDRTWEEMVECRDGVKLHTRMAMPVKDWEGKQFTTIVDR